MTPQMGSREFLRALCGLVDAYAILSQAIARALPPQLASIAAVDPLTRVTLEQFGDPLVRWFRRGSRLQGVHVADGTLVFDSEDPGTIRFIPDLAAEHADELPADWRERSRAVGRIADGRLELL